MAYIPPHRRKKQQEDGSRGGLSEWRGDEARRSSSRRSGGGRYVSAYEEGREERFKAESEAPIKQYAKMVEFSRYRREELGQRRNETEQNSRKRQSAPRAFGTNDHGRGMLPEEEVEGARRIDDEGMVNEIVDQDTKYRCIYFCDRFRRYKFFCHDAGLDLLKGLVRVNTRLLEANTKMFSANPHEAAEERAEGYALYEEKPNLRRKGAEIGTWSDREYGLPGFQWMYLRLKSFQRFCESWAILERCAAADLFHTIIQLDSQLGIISLGGGPGYELLAFDWFLRFWRAKTSQDTDWLRHTFPTVLESLLVSSEKKKTKAEEEEKDNQQASDIRFASFDLQPSWERYVSILGYDFKQFDIHAPDALDQIIHLYPDGRPLVCFLSNILCYCTDEATADLFTRLLTSGRVKAIIANERGAVQGIVAMLQRRGIVVVKLLDQQNAGRDDRQIVFLPPDSPPDLPNIPLAMDAVRIFPNQPYEEKKLAVQKQQQHP